MANQQDRAVIDLVINGQQGQTTLRSITTAAVNARRALSNMAETDPGYARQKRELEELMRAQQQRVVRLDQERKAFLNFSASAGQITAGITAAGAISGAVGLIGDGLRKAERDYKAFNAASQELSAVTGATGADLEYLNNQAKKVGPQMGKTGAEMLEAYKLMASAKPELLAQKELLVETTKAALTLAQAGKIDLAEATKVTAESLNQFGAGADQANRYINVIAAGAKEGSAEINEMGGALKNAGTVAASQNVSFEQTNAILQSMSTIALKGGEAGTGLRNVLLTLGGGADDTNPKVVGLDKALENLGKKMDAGLDLTKTFGKENVVAAQHIITHREEISQLTAKISGTNEAYSQAEKNNASYEHQMEMFDAVLTKVAVTVGTKIIPMFTGMLEGVMSIANGLDKWLSPAAETATAAFEDQRSKVQGLTTSIVPLLKRHDELKGKTSLSKKEQEELKTIVAEVSRVVPTAASQFDQYGKALDINTGKARKAIEIQQALAQELNKTAIAENTSQRDNDIAALKRVAAQKLSGKVVSVSRNNAGTVSERDLTDAELANLEKQRVDLQAKIDERNNVIRGLSGTDENSRRRARRGEAEPVAPAKPPVNTGSTTSPGGGGGESKEEKAARKKREQEAKTTARHEESLDDLMSQARQRTAKDEGDDHQKGQLALDQHYKKMEKLAKGNQAKLKEIAELKVAEQTALDAKEQERQSKIARQQADDQARLIDAKLKAAQEELELEQEIKNTKVDQQVGDGTITKEQGVEAKLANEQIYLEAKKLLYEAHYQSLLDVYAKFTGKQAELEQEKKAASLGVQQEITKVDGDQAVAKKATADAVVAHDKQSTEEQKKHARELYNAKKEIFNDSVTVIKGFFKENTIVYKAAMIAQQAWALGEVAMNLQRAVVAGIASAAGIPFPANLLAIGQAIAMPTLAAASAVANIRAQKFDVPQFAEGGFTTSGASPAGYTNGATFYSKRGYMAGEAGQEFIIPNPMLQNPVIANLAGAMEAMRVSGSYRNLSVGSGSMGQGQAPAAAGAAPDQSGYMMVAASIERMHRTLADQGGDKVVQDVIGLNKKQDRLKAIETRASL